MKHPFRLAGLCLLIALPLLAQNPAPTHRDVAYDDADKAQAVDAYLVESDSPMPVMVYIHGGGWRAGSKNRIPQWLRKGVDEKVFSVVSVEYRFTDVKPHPAQVNDCLHAIQFVRHKAKEWNLDPKRIGVTGGSAGGHLSLYVGLHGDKAKADSKDPVERHSSRVQCAVGFAGPTDWSLLKEIEHRHPAYRQLVGSEPGTPVEKMDAKAMKTVSPISFVSKDDPPIMIVHGDADDVVPVEHGRRLQKELKKAGVEVEMVIIKDGKHNVAGAGAGGADEAMAFVKKHL